jgi:uncharacterized protein YcbX
MANFNLADYETVEERIKRFYETHPDGRIVTHDYTSQFDRESGVWRVQAMVFESSADQAANLVKATGFAFEVDGQGMANKTSALENCETSAIGRALANAGFSGNKRTSREEMEKVARGVAPGKPVAMPKGFQELVTGSMTMDELKARWDEAVQGGFHEQIKQLVDSRKKALSV